MTITSADIFSVLLQSALATGGALWLLSTKVGERYLSHRFETKFTVLKHDQNQKLEALKAQLANLAGRGRHSNEREFAALTQIWELLVEAYLSTNTCIVSMTEYPDMTRLTDDEVQSFLNSTTFSEDQRKHIFDSKDRNAAYSRTVTLNDINKAGQDIQNVHLELRKKGIFVPAELVSQMTGVIKKMTSAWVERKMHFQKRNFHGNASTDFLASGEKMMMDVRETVRARLTAA